MTAPFIFSQLNRILPDLSERVISYQLSRTCKNAIILKIADIGSGELIFRYINNRDWSLSTKKGEI